MDVDAIAELLKHHIGLDMASVGRSAIENAIKTRIRKTQASDVRVYYQLLNDSPIELNELIEESIVPETWFFRDAEAIWSAVKEVNTYLGKNANTIAHILSLPCASGEEPYSLAMALLEAGIPEQRFQIDAIDLSQRLLERARRGIYGANSFRGVAVQPYRERYFERLGSTEWRLHDSIRGLIRFRQGNLVQARYGFDHKSYDIIFCRNLMIYFDRETQLRSTEFLTSLLRQGGTFYSGPAEGSLLLERGFRSNGVALAFGFRYSGQNMATQPIKPEPLKKTNPLITIKSPAQTTKPTALKNNANRRTIKANDLKPNNTPVPNFEDIANTANIGNLAEAIRHYQHLLQSNGPSPKLLCALALAQEANGERELAEQNYRKALYLDPNHEETMTHLALLLEMQGNLTAAQQLRQRSQRVRSENG